MSITVAICTHNPRVDYLAKVLQALKAQTLSQDNWELMLIDNASASPLSSELVQWHPGARLIREEKLGLTHARLRAIRESDSELIVFVDDDNVLSARYLEVAGKISTDYALIGAWSGQCHPGFDVTPAEWTRKYWGLLVIREFTRNYWSNLGHANEASPCGAGLCVRRAVANAYVALHDSGQRPMVLDRQGSSLMSAGDNDLSACACDIGLGVGLFHELELTHLIPENRVSEDYLVRLSEGIHYSAVYLKWLRGNLPPETSWARRLVEKLQGWRMSPRDRRLFLACCRGQNRALEELRNKTRPAMPIALSK